MKSVCAKDFSPWLCMVRLWLLGFLFVQPLQVPLLTDQLCCPSGSLYGSCQLLRMLHAVGSPVGVRFGPPGDAPGGGGAGVVPSAAAGGTAPTPTTVPAPPTFAAAAAAVVVMVS